MIRSLTFLTPFLLLPYVAAGCSSEKLNELANKAKQTVSEQADKITDSVKEKTGMATDAAKEQLALAGSCELTLDAPLSTSACYVTFLPQGSDRPSVLQLRSYREPAQESFPSVFFQAQVKAGGISELQGQTVPGELFVQKAQDGPIWSCKTGTHVDLKVVSTSADGKQMNAEFVGGAVSSSQSGADQPVTGKVNGVLQ